MYVSLEDGSNLRRQGRIWKLSINKIQGTDALLHIPTDSLYPNLYCEMRLGRLFSYLG